MKNAVSIFAIIIAGMLGCGTVESAPMTSQISRLMQEKDEKIKRLEKCDDKRKGWMIAGISTIGLTAVGVGVNIAQAKSNKLSDQIDDAKIELKKAESDLDNLNDKIAAQERENAKRECSQQENMQWKNGQCVPVETANAGGGIETSGVDGAIGEKCNDDKGVWFTVIEGNDKKCSNSAGEIVDCKCVETTGVTPKPGQGSGGGDKPVEKPKASETGGRIVGGACIEEDIKKLSSYGWVSGHYQKVGESVKTTLGVRCESKQGAGDSVNCSCRADECNGAKNYELDSNGLCVKKKVEKKEEENKEEKKKEEEKKEKPESKTLDVSVDGTGWGFYDIDGDYIEKKGCKVSNPGEWCVVFPDYTVSGKAVCNETSGTCAVASPSEQSNSGGKNCWCKMTEPSASRWVFLLSYSDASRCADVCSVNCAFAVKDNMFNFRGGVFGSVAK